MVTPRLLGTAACRGPSWPSSILRRHVQSPGVRDQAGALFDPRMVEAFLDVAPYRSLTPAAV